MSSRFGPRAVGTDGSDFTHRQKVARHYKESVLNKFRLKFTLVLHVLILSLIIVKIFLDGVSQNFGIYAKAKIPHTELWECWWTLSVVSLVLAYSSFARNNEYRMRLSYYGLVIFALIPLAFGAGSKLPELIRYVKGGDARLFCGFPLVVLWYIFFAVAFQVHWFTMYFEAQLVKAWLPVKTVKPKGD
ncbi:unnamed protein product [Soboliphyme baturini]|uniref:Protein jagunal n=1 Tax=Soboliphyme baturini TaxID=241478 RepID=A0A183IRK3_9BILA|nr:unnamed protein product [Soboliphyme baturini]